MKWYKKPMWCLVFSFLLPWYGFFVYRKKLTEREKGIGILMFIGWILTAGGAIILNAIGCYLGYFLADMYFEE